MLMDLHAHTYFSRCGRDDPDLLVQSVADAGIEVFGITDHNYGIGERLDEYRSTLLRLQTKYRARLTLLRGIELSTLPPHCLRNPAQLNGLDYALVENLDQPESLWYDRAIEYAQTLPIPMVIAHTDLIGFAIRTGRDPVAYLSSLTKAEIAWELNVNDDSIHGHRRHNYYLQLLQNPDLQQIVRQSGITLTVGFDGHRREEYAPSLVAQGCNLLVQANLPIWPVALRALEELHALQNAERENGKSK